MLKAPLRIAAASCCKAWQLQHWPCTKQHAMLLPQVGFMDYVALPLFNNFACVFPHAKPMLDLALSTYK